MKNRKKVAIIGFGKLGQALANLLETKKENCYVCSWDVVETGDPRQSSDVVAVIDKAEIFFLCVPSKNLRESLENLKSVTKTAIFVCCTKGLDPESGKFPFELVQESFPENPTTVISGPMLSEELELRLPTRASLASHPPDQAQTVVELFQGTTLTLEKSADLIGTSSLGVLKNIYTLALGLSDGLNLGSNFKSCLSLVAFREMAAIAKELGGDANSLLSPAGLADFLATAYSEKSRNYVFGFKKARGENPIGLMAEGVINIDNIRRRLKQPETYFFLRMIAKIFLENEDPRQLLKVVE